MAISEDDGIFEWWPSQKQTGPTCTLVFVEVFGQRRAETLMSAIPLHDLDQVATKADLQVLGAELRAEFHAEIGALRKTMTSWMLGQSVAIMAAIVGSILGVAFLS